MVFIYCSFGNGYTGSGSSGKIFGNAFCGAAEEGKGVVTEAEKELGSGTGQLKLRYVYDLFLQRFPAVAKRISFETFSYWVDRALIDMREMLSKNKAIYRMVKAEEGAENGTD